jgi:hypothetical protein
MQSGFSWSNFWRYFRLVIPHDITAVLALGLYLRLMLLWKAKTEMKSWDCLDEHSSRMFRVLCIRSCWTEAAQKCKQHADRSLLAVHFQKYRIPLVDQVFDICLCVLYSRPITAQLEVNGVIKSSPGYWLACIILCCDCRAICSATCGYYISMCSDTERMCHVAKKKYELQL